MHAQTFMRRPSNPRAFSLLEVLVATTVMMAVIGAALVLLANTNRSVGDHLAIADTAQRANRLTEVLNRELRAAGQLFLDGESGVTSSGAFTRVTYNVMTGFDWGNGGPAYDEAISPQRQLRFVPAESSASNGADDDRDGLIDEGDLILFFDSDDSGTFSAGEQRAVIARDVAGDTLSISLQPSLADTRQATDTHLRISFETLRRLPDDSRQIIHRERIDLSIALRNN